MPKFTKLLSLSVVAAIAIAATGVIATTSPSVAQQYIINNDPRLPVVADQNFFCVASYCYYNPDGLTSKEISGGIFLVLLLYGWINRHNLIYWWRVEMEKLQPSKQRRAARLVTRPATKSRPVNSSERTPVNIRPPIDPQKFWYVYRQGGTHGPYEKFQLRGFEKITANSLVRRAGEKKWVKAGEIPELADYLE